MDTSCKKICRFCLKTSDSNFKTIEEVIFANLDFLWLKVNLSISEQPVMCGDCAKTIKISSDFKTKCLEIENCIMSSIKDKDSNKIDLRSHHLQIIYVNNMPMENIVNVSEDYVVCRLCLELVKNDSVILLRNHTDVIEKLERNFSELDLTCTDDPVICASCQVSLQCYFSFINTCSTAEEKIMEYCKVEGTNSMGQVDLNSVVYFTSKGSIMEMRNEVSENTSYSVEMKKEEILHTELDIKEESSAQESELISEIRFQHHSSPSHSGCVPQLTGVKPTKYSCEICGKRKHDLQVHMITYKDGTEVTMYKCDLCDLDTKRKSYLKERMLTQKTHSEITMYKCDQCDYKAKRKSDLSRHTRSLRSHSDIMYKCDLCVYQAKWKSDVKKHMLIHKTHSEVVTYKCDLCDYVTKCKKYLNRHIITHKTHLETTIYKCDLCDYQTKWKSCLKRHTLTHKTHSEITTYKCDLCDYKAKERYVLKRHMVTHETLSEIYKCEACAYKTRRKEYMKQHKLNHMEMSEIEMYKWKDQLENQLSKTSASSQKHSRCT